MLTKQDGKGIRLWPKDAKAFFEALRNISLARKNSLALVEKAEERPPKKPAKRQLTESRPSCAVEDSVLRLSRMPETSF